MGKLEKYTSYRDSGVEWLGEIPEHWEVKKLKFLTRNLNNRRTPIESTIRGKMENRIYDYYGATGVIDKVENYIFNESTIIIAEDGANLLFRNIQLVYLADGKYWVNNHAHILKTISGNNRYFIANALENTNYTTLISGSAQPKLTKENLNNVLLAVPPKEEQTKIASFLDEKTAQIDKAISQKEKLIELLKERRQITINDAVTKGLDKDVEFKDSGVEWIGKIPKHWKINRLKFLFKIRKRIANSLGYDVLSITQKGIKVKDIDSGEGQLAMDYSKYQLAFKGDFAMNHMDLLTGYIDISNFDGVISPDYRVFTLEDSNCIPEYYLRLFQMCYHEKIFYAFGQGVSQLGRWRFPADNFNNFFVPIPPKDEQIQIVEYIETQTAKIDKAIELQQNYITKLKEYKATLIDSVVTGKMRVG